MITPTSKQLRVCQITETQNTAQILGEKKHLAGDRNGCWPPAHRNIWRMGQHRDWRLKGQAWLVDLSLANGCVIEVECSLLFHARQWGWTTPFLRTLPENIYIYTPSCKMCDEADGRPFSNVPLFHLCAYCPFPGGTFLQSGHKIEAVFYLRIPVHHNPSTLCLWRGPGTGCR